MHEVELKGIRNDSARAIRLAELNVEFGVSTLLSNYVVEEAVRDRGLKVHGILYDIASGRLRDLGFGTAFQGPPRESFEIVRGNHGMLTFGGGEAKMTIRWRLKERRNRKRASLAVGSKAITEDPVLTAEAGLLNR
jgi:carbonic anhydrase